MNDLLVIAHLLKQLPHDDLKVMANLLCEQMDDEPDTDWSNPLEVMDLISAWADSQLDGLAEQITIPVEENSNAKRQKRSHKAKA